MAAAAVGAALVTATAVATAIEKGAAFVEKGVEVAEKGWKWLCKLLGRKQNKNLALPAPPLPSAPPGHCRADDPPPRYQANDPTPRYSERPQYKEPVFCFNCQRDIQSCHGCGDPVRRHQRQPELRKQRAWSPLPPQTRSPRYYDQQRPRFPPPRRNRSPRYDAQQRPRSPTPPPRRYNTAPRAPVNYPNEDEQMRTAMEMSLQSLRNEPQRIENIRSSPQNRHAHQNSDRNQNREQARPFTNHSDEEEQIRTATQRSLADSHRDAARRNGKIHNPLPRHAPQSRDRNQIQEQAPDLEYPSVNGPDVNEQIAVLRSLSENHPSVNDQGEDEQTQRAMLRSYSESHPIVPRNRQHVQNSPQNRRAPLNQVRNQRPQEQTQGWEYPSVNDADRDEQIAMLRSLSDNHPSVNDLDGDEQTQRAMFRSLSESYPSVPRNRQHMQNSPQNRHAPLNRDRNKGSREQLGRRSRAEQEATDMAIARSFQEPIAPPQRGNGDKSDQENMDRAIAKSLHLSFTG